MSKIEKLPTLAEITARHAAACDFKQKVDRTKIIAAFQKWAELIIKRPMEIVFVENFGDVTKHGKDARDARDAWDARAARAAGWDCSYHAIAAVGALSRADKKVYAEWLPVLEALEAGAWLFWVVDEKIVVAEIPKTITVDEQRRLHGGTGPTFAWLDDVRDYYWHGVNVAAHVIEAPEKITLKEIDAQENIEVQRVMIERYGMSRYLIDSKAEQIHADKFGVLYRKNLKRGEPIVMVKVVNSTPEKGKVFREYFLPVDAALRPLPPGHWPLEKKRAWLEKQAPQELTAHNAVASTWGRRGEIYNPTCQT